MNAGEFKSSISQVESNLTTSRKKLYDKFEKLKSDFKELQECIVEKNRQIAELKTQKKDLISLLDQAFAIIDDPSQTKLLEDLCEVESEVKALLGIAKAEEQKAAGSLRAGGSVSIEPLAGNGDKADPGEQAKKWARDLLKGVGEVTGRGPARPSRA